MTERGLRKVKTTRTSILEFLKDLQIQRRKAADAGLLQHEPRFISVFLNNQALDLAAIELDPFLWEGSYVKGTEVVPPAPGFSKHLVVQGNQLNRLPMTSLVARRCLEKLLG